MKVQKQMVPCRGGGEGDQEVCKEVTEYSVFVISDEMGENVDG